MRKLAPLSPGFVFALAVGCSGDDSGWVEAESAEQSITVGTTYTLTGVHSGKCVQFANNTDLTEAHSSVVMQHEQYRHEPTLAGDRE